MPSAFCWTKMQTEAGQGLYSIIRRKELERSIGNGVFYWGIGNSLGNSMDHLLLRTPNPEVLFSIMRAKPKVEDVSPASVLLWTCFIDEQRTLHPLPCHALVLSRADTESGMKKRCYALVCHSTAMFTPLLHASLDHSHLRNLGGNQRRLAFSQVTANVEHVQGKHDGIRYEVSLRTHLKPPYFIRLAGPKRLLMEDREAIRSIVARCPKPDEWRHFVQEIRNRPEYTAHSERLCDLSQ